MVDDGTYIDAGWF